MCANCSHMLHMLIDGEVRKLKLKNSFEANYTTKTAKQEFL